MNVGSLVVVGTGYGAGAQITPEAESVIRSSDHVFFLVTHPATAHAIRGLAAQAESLAACYEDGINGEIAARAMVERIIAPLASGARVCAAFDGHAAIYAWPGLEAMRRASADGHSTQMLPGVSALDCMFADVGLDPGRSGYQLFEATDFVLRRRTIDVATPLVILQAGVPGRTRHVDGLDGDERGIEILVARLLESYAANHEVIVYELAQLPIEEPRIERMALSELPRSGLKVYSTLLVPAARRRALDYSRLERLGLAVVDGKVVARSAAARTGALRDS